MNPEGTALLTASVPPEERQSLIKRALDKSRLVLLLAATIALWEVYTWVVDVPAYLLPSPQLIFADFIENPEYVLRAFAITTTEAVVGFAIAVGVGFVLAVLIARSVFLEQNLYPYLNIIRVTPVIAIAPLLTIWFGHGLIPMIIVSALVAFFPIVVTTALGLRSPDPDLITLMRTLNATELVVLRKVRLPNALPYMFSSFRISAPLAVVGALVGEFVGGSAGLGRVLVTAHNRVDTSMMFLMIFLAVVLGITAFALIVAVERRLIHWHPSARLE